MEYITIKEASEKWCVGTRIVTLYCNTGRIEGAIKRGNLWLIPRNAVKPEDKRQKKGSIQKRKVQEENESAMDKSTYGLIEQGRRESACSIQSLDENNELFVKIMKHFPYPMHICAPDGTMLLANEAFFQFAKVSDTEGDLRKHNVLRDPNLERWGIKDFVQRAYQGELVHAYDVKVPIQEIVDKFGGNSEFLSESLFHNMTSFPIHNENNELSYIVTVFITSRYYHDKEEIIKGKEYIDDHWNEEFDIDELADVVHMSRYHYTRMFKQHTGMTPYNYYQDVKINKLEEKLCDINLSITQAFDECGVNYNGSLAKKFKQKLGMTPSQYRAMMIKK